MSTRPERKLVHAPPLPFRASTVSGVMPVFQKLHASQAARHRRQMAVHAVQGGDRGGASATPDIKERD